VHLVHDLGVDDSLAIVIDVDYFVGILLADNPAVVVDVGGEKVVSIQPFVDRVGKD